MSNGEVLVDTCPHITKPTHTHTHTPTHHKTSLNNNSTRYTPNKSHNTIKYPQYQVTLNYTVVCPQALHRTSPRCTSKRNHFTQTTSVHTTSLHFTYLHSIPITIFLLVTTFLTLSLNVFNLQGTDASKIAGNRFQLLVFLFTKEHLPTSVICFLYCIQSLNAGHFMEYETEIIWHDVKCFNICFCLNIQN